jgi:hypothetical protein
MARPTPIAFQHRLSHQTKNGCGVGFSGAKPQTPVKDIHELAVSVLSDHGWLALNPSTPCMLEGTKKTYRAAAKFYEVP